MSAKGKMHVYIGDGKGKTTAALGLMMRYLGSGGRVIFMQFLKPSTSCEISILEDLDNITLMPNPWNYGFTWDMTDAEKEEAKGIYEQCMDLLALRTLQGNFGMIVMDEVLNAIRLGFIEEEQIMDLLDQLPDDIEVVMTGKTAPQYILDGADYVTEMKKVKHPYDQGQRARKGIEY